jgi:ABC-type branched-subunit amino acid transport system ATPase component/branched-subunit amino acid ABC-type transport system permease component
MEPLQFALLGFGVGGIYALAALGLVLVHRGSGVINFAHGAIGMVGAYLYWELRANHGWPFWRSFAMGLLVPAVLGLLIHYLFMRRLRHSSRLSQMMITIGVLIVLQGLALHRYPQVATVVPSYLPIGVWKIGGARVGEDRLILCIIAVGTAVMLSAIYRYTSFGRRTSAVAESRRTAAALGCSPDRIAALNWAFGSMLAALGALLIAPISGLRPTQMTQLLIPALAAAVVGNLNSFSVTAVAAIAIGVIQSELGNYSTTPGLSTAVPLLLVVAVLLLRGRNLPDRAQVGARLWKVGNGRVTASRVVPPAVAVFAFVVVAPLAWVNASTVSIIFAIVLLSLVVVTGYGGQLSLAQWTLAGVGGWFAAKIVIEWHWSFVPALLAAVIAMVPVGLVVGLPALRTRGVNLAIVTLALAAAVSAVVFESVSLAGGPNGLTVGDPSLFGLDVDNVNHPRRYAILVLVAFVLVLLVVGNVRRGRSGRRLIAVRENERAAAAMGISVLGAKLYAFSLAAAIAGLGGVLYAFLNPITIFDQYSPDQSETLVAFSVIGGLGLLLGPALGSILVGGGLGSRIAAWLGSWVANYLTVIGGGLLIANLLQSPDGVAAPLVRARKNLHRRGFQPSPPSATSDVGVAAVAPVVPRVLTVDHLRVTYGGVVAVADLSFTVRPGEIVGLIGPNGAGKTTVLDAISGFAPGCAGSVRLGGVDLSRTKPHTRARRGLCRSFQSLELLGDVSVWENLLVATDRRNFGAYFADLIHPGRGELSPSTRAAIDEFGLSEVLHDSVNDLSLAARRLTGVARAVASEPSIVMMDEPAAGLDEAATRELGRLVRYLARDRQMGVLLVEHNVDMVIEISDRVIVLAAGALIADGPPTEVRQHAEVIRVYLGEAVDANSETVAAACTLDQAEQS